MAWRKTRAACDPVVQFQTCFVVREVKAAVTRSDEFSCARKKRSILEHVNPLMQGAFDDFIFSRIEMAKGFFQVTHAAVHHLCGSAGGGGDKIGGIDKNRPEPAQLGIERTARACGAAANHTHIERPALNVFERFRAALHSEVARVRGDAQELAVAPLVATGLAAFLPYIAPRFWRGSRHSRPSRRSNSAAASGPHEPAA